MIRIQPELMASIWKVSDTIPETVLPIETIPCPHCGCPVRYPFIAGERDIEVLQKMITAAQEFLNETGVTAAMLASIEAKCAIAIARKT